MTTPDPLLTARSLCLAKVEATFDTDSLPVPATDAFLVSDADVRVDANVLERDNYRPHLSPVPIIIGRKLVNVTFSHELKASGTLSTAAKIGTLLRGCGFAETAVTAVAADQLANVQELGDQAGPDVAWAKTTAPTSNVLFKGGYRVKVVTSGATAVAEVRVSQYNGPNQDTTVLPSERMEGFATDGSTYINTIDVSDLTSITHTITGTLTVGDVLTAVIGGIGFSFTMTAAETTVTLAAAALAAVIDADSRLSSSGAIGVITTTFVSGAAEVVLTTTVTALALGNSGAQITPTWTGNLVAGDEWYVLEYPVGVRYAPISTGHESLTLYVYYDGFLHKITGCMGTFVINGEAGNYGSVDFTFTGSYVEPTDAILPTTSVFEQSKPTQIELAQLMLLANPDFCAQSFNIDMANVIQPRDCVNATDGFNGSRLTDRAPSGTINPEMQLRRNHPFWTKMAAAEDIPFHVRAGTVAGNIVSIVSSAAQYAGLTYGDRNGIRTIDVALRFSSITTDGDDELELMFY